MRTHLIEIPVSEINSSIALEPQLIEKIREILILNNYNDPHLYEEELIYELNESKDIYYTSCKFTTKPHEWVSIAFVDPPAGFVLDVKHQGGATSEDVIYNVSNLEREHGYFDQFGAGGKLFNITHFRIKYKSIVNKS
jgi:hypothetical protein